MKKTPNPGHLNSKQAEIPKARYVCNSSDEDECHEAFHLNPNQVKADIRVTIKGTPVQVCIDSGATANTIDYATDEAISAAKNSALKKKPVWNFTLMENTTLPQFLSPDSFSEWLRQGKWT